LIWPAWECVNLSSFSSTTIYRLKAILKSNKSMRYSSLPTMNLFWRATKANPLPSSSKKLSICRINASSRSDSEYSFLRPRKSRT